MRAPCSPRSIGVEKRWAKRSWLPSRPGLIKRNRFHNSPRWFSTGVPLAISLKSACRVIAACERLLWEFLIAWASSSTTLVQCWLAKAWLSCCNRP
ncbi:hypothetical protein D9M68_982070 [compost metagenome]